MAATVDGVVTPAVKPGRNLNGSSRVFDEAELQSVEAVLEVEIEGDKDRRRRKKLRKRRHRKGSKSDASAHGKAGGEGHDGGPGGEDAEVGKHKRKRKKIRVKRHRRRSSATPAMVPSPGAAGDADGGCGDGDAGTGPAGGGDRPWPRKCLNESGTKVPIGNFLKLSSPTLGSVLPPDAPPATEAVDASHPASQPGDVSPPEAVDASLQAAGTLLNLDADFDEGELSLFAESDNDDTDRTDYQFGILSNEQEIRWTKSRLLGMGAFGKVFLGTDSSGRMLAVKVLEVSLSGDRTKVEQQIRMVENEIRTMRSLVHENIVRYIGAGRLMDENAFGLNIFMEYVEGGSLEAFLDREGPMDEGVCTAYTYQLVLGLAFLHSQRIIHRDIKPGNVLLSPTPLMGCPWTLKIADFGASAELGDMVNASMDGRKTLTGTPNYMAPEVVLATGTGRSADIWSLGCTILHMLTGCKPWDAMLPIQVLLHLGQKRDHPPYPEGVSPCGRMFLDRTFAKEPKERATAVGLLTHPWVAPIARAHDSGRRASLFCLSVSSLRDSTANSADSSDGHEYESASGSYDGEGFQGRSYSNSP